MNAPDAPRRVHVLIVDDETAARDFLDLAFRQAGYITARAMNGQEALEMAEQFGPFDLLVTDEMLPRMEGHELADRLREREPWLKVLYLTGHLEHLLRAKATPWDEEVCLEKPSSVERLLETVSGLLAGRAERAAS